jgi:hypothetical protein
MITIVMSFNEYGLVPDRIVIPSAWNCRGVCAIGIRQQVRSDGTSRGDGLDVAVAVAAHGTGAIVVIASAMRTTPTALVSPPNMYCRAERDSRPSTLQILKIFGI